MNILFYIEPLIQMDNPNIQGYWLFHHIKIMLESIKKLDNNKCSFALNTSLVKILENVEYRNEIEKIYTFHQKELKIFSPSSIEIIKKWYELSYSEKEMEDYKKILSNKFEKAEFDVIIAFSPVPYLKKIFPKALILHYEFGIFSRPPFSVTFFLDPVGPGGYSYIKQFNSNILKNLKISDSEEKLFESFLEETRKIVLKENPFSEKIKKIREKYKRIILLPLQFNNFYLFDLESNYKTQFEYLEDALIKTSKLEDTGILVTQHPGARILNAENIKYFEENYSNFIFLENSINYSSVSQLIMPFVDAVITVSSSVGYHALLWDKKLITLGKNYLKDFSDSDNLDNLENMFQEPYDNITKHKLLYWIITNYAIPEDYIKNEKWLDSYFKRGIENLDNLENFYKFTDNPEKIFNHLLGKFSRSSVESLVDNYFIAFIDAGDGYTSDKSYKLSLGGEKKLIFLENYNIKSIILRFYGVNLIKINGITIKDQNNKIISITKKESSYYEIYPNNFYIDLENYLLFDINLEVKEIYFEIEEYRNIDIREILEIHKGIKKELEIKELEKLEFIKQLEIKELEKLDIINKKNLEIQVYDDLIKNIEESVNQILVTRSNKFQHFCNRLVHQLFLGSFSEKKRFINWLMRKQEELDDERYNYILRLKKIKKKKEGL